MLIHCTENLRLYENNFVSLLRLCFTLVLLLFVFDAIMFQPDSLQNPFMVFIWLTLVCPMRFFCLPVKLLTDKDVAQGYKVEALFVCISF